MRAQVLRALQIINPSATSENLRHACRRLFIESDEYHCALPQPYDDGEVDAVANAIFQYVTDPDMPALAEITFHVFRPPFGTTLEYNEFASAFSGDMLYQNLSTEYASLELDELRSALATFLAGMLFRYQFCVFEDRAAFPVSIILKYMDGVKHLLTIEHREGELANALWTTARALASLEPRFREEETVNRLFGAPEPKKLGGENEA